MGNDARNTRNKDEVSSGLKKKPNGGGGGKNDSSVSGSAASGSVSGETSGLRRSIRGQSNASPGSLRKSPRIVNRIPEVGSLVTRSGRVSGKGASSPSLRSGKVQSKGGGVRPTPEGSKKEKTLNEIAEVEEESEKRGSFSKGLDEEGECGKGEEGLKKIGDGVKVKEKESPSPDVGDKRKKRLDARQFKAMFKHSIGGRSEPESKKRRLDNSNDNCDSGHGNAGEDTRGNGDKDLDNCNVNPEERQPEICQEDLGKGAVEPSEEPPGCSAEDGMEGDSANNVNDGSSDLEKNIRADKLCVPSPFTLEVKKNSGDCADVDMNGVVVGELLSQDVHLHAGKLSDVGEGVNCRQNESVPQTSSVGDGCTFTTSNVALSEEDCAKCLKKQRLHYDSYKQELCSCLSDSINIAGLTSVCQDRVEFSNATGEDGQNRIENGPSADGPQKSCVICKRVGKLLCCDGKGCRRCYHPSCLQACEEYAHISIWYCSECMKKKLELGVHSVSQGIELILDVRDVELPASEEAPKQKQYLVKYKGLAHIHSQWVGKAQLLHEAPELLLKLNEQETHWNPEWVLPHRLLRRRSIIIEDEESGLASRSQHEWLVKWRGLDYDQATWELEDSENFKKPDVQQLLKEYETRHNGARTANTSADSKIQEGTKSSHVKHGRPSETSRGESCFLNLANKLCEYQQKSHNTVLLDEQDRAVKIAHFVSSIFSNVRRPFLIVTSHASLSYWEAEFSRLAASINFVVYGGNAVSRKLIRSLELSEEGGQPMLQVLLSSVEAVSEDLEELRDISWGAVIVDDCQEACILRHSDCIKTLTTNWMLLLLNGQIMETTGEYISLLSLLESGGNSFHDHIHRDDSIDELHVLKERLSSFILSARFQEYWVPVQISNVQLEQYCSLLLSNSTILSSCFKSDPMGSLHDILVSSQKCCNHPHVDPSLRKLLPEGYTHDAVVDLEVKANGKLQLLGKILSEFRNQALKVVILFQSSAGYGPGKTTLGVLLEDFLASRFGGDSYEHVAVGGQPSKKKQAAWGKFNKERKRSFLLLETRACHSSIKLSSVDAVIIYSSDWNPLNDLRALQKITIDSKLKKINVFRLYCTCTIEERFLIFAKNETILDSTAQVINPSTKQMLLMWGSLYLFSRLDAFHGDGDSNDIENIAYGTSFLSKVFQEVVSCCQNLGNCCSSKYVSLARQDSRSYLKTTVLFGEQRTLLEDSVPSHTFWKKLLEGKQPQWKYLSGSSERYRKRVHYSDDLPLPLNVHTEEAVKKRNDSSPRQVGQNPLKLNGINNGQPEEFGAEVIIASGSKVNNISSKAMVQKTVAIGTGCNPAGMKSIEQDDRRTLHEQRGLFKELKPSILKLCEVLLFEDEEKRLAEKFLEYVLNNHRVTSEPDTILQALLISVCWTAAAVLKKKIDHKKSLDIAREMMDFRCKDNEADLIHDKMKLLMKIFLSRSGNLSIPNLKVSPASAIDSITSDPRENVGDSPVSLGNKEFGINKVRSLEELANKEKDSQGCVEKVQQKCEKKMERLKQKQHEEFLNFENFWEEKRAELVKNLKLEATAIRYSHGKSTIGLDKLKNLDNDYAKKRQDLENQISNRRKELEARQQEERDTELKKIARLFELVIPMSQDKRSGNPPFSNKVQSHAAELIGSCMDLDAPVSITENLSEEEASRLPQPVLSTNNREISSTSDVPSRLSDEQRAYPENGTCTPSEDISTSQVVGTINLARERNSSLGLPGGKVVPDTCQDKGAAECNATPAEEVSKDTNEVDTTLDDSASPTSNDGNAFCCTSTAPLMSTVSSADASASQVCRAEEQIGAENRNTLPGCETLSMDLANPVPSELPRDEGTSVAPDTEHSLFESVTHPSSVGQTMGSSGGRVGGPQNEAQRVIQNASIQMPQQVPHLGATSGGALTARSTHSNSIPVTNTTTRVSPNFSDPLQNEYDRIRKEVGETMTSHEEMKLRLRSECDKEIKDAVSQIQLKYDVKLGEAEKSFSNKKMELEMIEHMVIMNKFLADAFRSKCMDYKAGPQGGLQKAIAGMASSSADFPLQLPSPSGPFSAASSLPVVASAASPHSTTPVRGVHPSTTAYPGMSSRHLHNNPLASSAAFKPGRHEMRPTASQSQPKATLSVMASSSMPSSSVLPQQQPINNHCTYFSSSQIQSRPSQSLSSQPLSISSSHGQPNQAGVGSSELPIGLSLNSAHLRMNIPRQNEQHLRQLSDNLPPLPVNLQNHDSWDLSQFGRAADVQRPASHAGAGDVVCLSDDDE